VAIETHLAPLPIDPAHDHVRVRMVRVVVVDRRPFEPAPKVLLDLRHPPPHEVGEIELPGILRRHDQPELMLLPPPRLVERLRARRPVGDVQPPRGPVLLDPVALDIPQVQCGRLGATEPHARYVRLDGDPPRIRARPVHGDPRASRHLACPAPAPTAHRAEHCVAKRPRRHARRRPVAATHPRLKNRENAEFVHSGIPPSAWMFNGLRRIGILHGSIGIQLFLIPLRQIHTTGIPLFILQSLFPSRS
jgi:hypothetical protein